MFLLDADLIDHHISGLGSRLPPPHRSWPHCAVSKLRGNLCV
jgi:hypothetical protein